jgi:hypothetical protein
MHVIGIPEYQVRSRRGIVPGPQRCASVRACPFAAALLSKSMIVIKTRGRKIEGVQAFNWWVAGLNPFERCDNDFGLGDQFSLSKPVTRPC